MNGVVPLAVERVWLQVPLRERADDILLIAQHVLAKYAREMGRTLDGFSPEAAGALRAYLWPGNVRELENVIERAVALESEPRVQLGTLPENLRSGRPSTPVGGGESHSDEATRRAPVRRLCAFE